MEPKLLAWGFAPRELEEVKACVTEAEVAMLTTLPERAPELPLLVSAAKVSEFVQWAEARTMEDGIQPKPVLLYRPAGMPEPDAAWGYCDGVVSDDDWSRLETLLECPHVLDAELAAADVPARFLRNLTCPVTKLPVAKIPFGDPEWDHADSEIRQHLATCVTCRAAFNAALEWRMALREQMLRPEPKRQKWIVMQFTPIAPPEQQQQWVLAALLAALVAAQMRPRAKRLLGEGKAVKADDLPDLLSQLPEGMAFVRPYRELSLQLTDDRLVFDSLRGDLGRRVKNFRLELRRGEETLWGADSVEGRVSLPLTDLEQAFIDGADQLVILTPPEEE
jgi:hypothetical protein